MAQVPRRFVVLKLPDCQTKAEQKLSVRNLPFKGKHFKGNNCLAIKQMQVTLSHYNWERNSDITYSW
jgi:hypothetical protein